ncbi:nucleoside phosphorylase [Coprobacter tertius]|uniref:Uridine phosphorylase n=1 Tax=Coprobacter tertius TaxID=2944915 RepID=A0ABT1MG12_9BACT|nr:nucleoside phosphorylase [Coprobacter tertius]MCP9611575.1 nucleoside phosphorylase [Coprobacter tertius]
MKHFPESELIINDDGSIFHLHLRPEQLADKVILVGDPSRVDMVASFFDTRECDVSNREFHTITGMYKGKRLTVVSHGIGTDNIDIVINELDALSNIDFETRDEKAEFRQLTLVRIGTSGGLQPHVPVGTFVISEKSIGFDGVLNFYAGRNEVCDLDFEAAFRRHVGWSPLWAAPYVIDAASDLVESIGQGEMVKGVTISANGFYGPQGRELRVPLADPELNKKIESFKYADGHVITNYEMESSALAGLAKLMGHKAMTVCSIIANRVAHNANSNYKNSISDLIQVVLDRI